MLTRGMANRSLWFYTTPFQTRHPIEFAAVVVVVVVTVIAAASTAIAVPLVVVAVVVASRLLRDELFWPWFAIVRI